MPGAKAMTASGQPDRSKWLSDRNAVHRYYGNEQIAMEFLARTIGDARRVRDILNAAYQTGRSELMQELADLAAEGGGKLILSQFAKMGSEENAEDVLHKFSIDTDRCICGGNVVYFEDTNPPGEGCEVEGEPWSTWYTQVDDEIVWHDPQFGEPTFDPDAPHGNPHST